MYWQAFLQYDPTYPFLCMVGGRTESSYNVALEQEDVGLGHWEPYVISSIFCFQNQKASSQVKFLAIHRNDCSENGWKPRLEFPFLLSFVTDALKIDLNILFQKMGPRVLELGCLTVLRAWRCNQIFSENPPNEVWISPKLLAPACVDCFCVKVARLSHFV